MGPYLILRMEIQATSGIAVGTAEIDRRMPDTIGKKGNGLASDTQEKIGIPYSDTWNGRDTVGPLSCRGTAANSGRA